MKDGNDESINLPAPSTNKNYVLLRSFVEAEDQILLCQEALECHKTQMKITTRDNDDNLFTEKCDDSSSPSLSFPSFQTLSESKNSIKLDLGIQCGGNLIPNLPLATSVIRKAFSKAQEQLFCNSNDNEGGDSNNSKNAAAKAILKKLSKDDLTIPLTGLALLYGPRASMTAHYDSPTQPGQRHEWLACISLGDTALFRCNNELLKFRSGDVLVMDSMAVLHGVETILVDDCTTCQNHHPNQISHVLPPNSRLGILMWQGKMNCRSDNAHKEKAEETQKKQIPIAAVDDDVGMEGITDLFQNESF